MKRVILRDDAKRFVAVYEDGSRLVVHLYGDGESWWKWVIVPRSEALRRVQMARRQGVPWNGFEDWHLHSAELPMSPEHYGGPGRYYSTAPFRINNNRRYLVWAQHGGLDV